ncbi:hypothetical protein BDV37DRAFT_256052 [Aspergillus pseudonomiae]|uniref:Uncharacterized protein n=1 Tax=Aspergillus pseudonomiae TaxID=1506151 RepID=A0A5N7D3R2_9EURO|nr:uncharacterized protein BDV37DRAFT_256052 [Aspergillus pseudonomiae]KAE8401052.1 hypothetical protein BDV37DRAFT_256052 [Aspergillus pseudonomiae]
MLRSHLFLSVIHSWSRATIVNHGPSMSRRDLNRSCPRIGSGCPHLVSWDSARHSVSCIQTPPSTAGTANRRLRLSTDERRRRSWITERTEIGNARARKNYQILHRPWLHISSSMVALDPRRRVHHGKVSR